MNKYPLKIAITGGIGSGKSLIAKIFNSIDIPIYQADLQAKRLMNKDKALKVDIRNLLGKEAYHRNGRLNRQYVASQVFNNSKLLLALNKLVHPAVRRDFEAWAERQNSPYVLEESAIVFEVGLAKYFKAVILVVADKEVRISRVMKRDGITRKQVLSRMKHQNPEKDNKKSADYIIINDGSESLVKQVQNIHQRIMKLKKK